MTRRRAAAGALTLAVAVVAAWLGWPSHEGVPGLTHPATTGPATQVVVAGTRLSPGCAAAAPFRPRRLSVPGAVRDAAVLAVARDANGIPGTPPLTSRGKAEVAWDPGRSPGTPRGNVLLNAHTWPDGSALGNRLLAGLGVGGRIVVRGGAERLCYRVTRKVVVRAEDGLNAYYATDGPPQLAIVVCSGRRLGPGRWTHRTVWFASPEAAA